MFSSNTNCRNNNNNNKSRRIHRNSSHGSGSLPCKEEEEEITSTDSMMIHSIEQQEYERLLRIAEQSLRERDTTGDAVFLEMERIIMNDIEQEKKEDNSINEQALVTASTSTAPTGIEDEDKELVVMTTREEQEDVGYSELKEQRVLLAVDADNRPTKRKRRQSENAAEYKNKCTFEEPSSMHQVREYHKERHRKKTLPKEHAFTLLEKEGADLNLNEVDNVPQKKKIYVPQKKISYDAFEERVDQLREYKKQYGTTTVSSIIDKQLYNWFYHQKIKFRDGTLQKERALVLEAEGVDLKLSHSTVKTLATFDERIQQLKDYKAQHGTANVLRNINLPLYCWLYTRKVKYREGTLSKGRVSALEKEGVDLNLILTRTTFEERVDQLREYKEQYGTVNVSKSINQPLYSWLNEKKAKLRNGTLQKEHALVLEEEGVDVKSIKSSFDERIQQLKDYKAQHGTEKVSRNINRPLYHWLSHQKMRYRKGTLPKKEHALVLEREVVGLTGYR